MCLLLAPARAAGEPGPAAAGHSGSSGGLGAGHTAPQPERVRTPTSGLVTIESDLQRADNRTGVITATGNVRIVYADQRVVATARQAQYFSREGRVILSGDVDIVQEDGHALRAERVLYDVNSERLLAEPPSGRQVTSRVRIPASRSAETAR
jgi:lipopolysaccharide export system protein LptA